MRHPGNLDEFLEVLRYELGSIVRSNSWSSPSVLLPTSLNNGLDMPFLHPLSDLEVQDASAIAIKHPAEVVEGAFDVDVIDVDMPMEMRGIRPGNSLAL